MPYKPRYVFTGVWDAHLTRKHREIGVSFPPAPTLSAEEQGWQITRIKPTVANVLTVADVFPDRLAGNICRLPCEAPKHDAGVNGKDLYRAVSTTATTFETR